MTELIIHILFALALAAGWAAALRYDAQMFQQNSYMPSRYWTWLRPVLLRHFRLLAVAALACCLLPFGAWRLLPAALLLALLAWKEFSSRYKICLAYTLRVIRLLAVTVLLGAALVALVWVLWGLRAAVIAACALPVVDKGLLLVANLCLAPVEAAIRRWYYNDAARMLRSRPDLVIVGITGSYGKTSTKNFLYRMLSERYNTLITPGNFNTTLGVVRTIREQLKPYHQVFIVEMGAKQRGDIREICDLVHPGTGIVTAVGPMHLETFGSLEAVQQTKFELIRALPQDGTGIVNLSSPGIASYADRPASCVTYGLGADAQWRVGELACSAAGTSFTLSGPGQTLSLQTRLLGEGNILDIAGAAVAALGLGVTPAQIRTAVGKLQSVEHRLSVRRQGFVTVLDDAYNSNPEGARMALDVLRSMEGGRKIVITPGFVELGDRQAEANRALGAQAAGVADLLIVVNQLNREALCAGAAEAGLAADRLKAVDSLSEAVSVLSGYARQGDIVLYENDLPDMFK